MYVEKISLLGFRNHTLFNHEFAHPQTIFVAPNGAGKTNILEALYLLATGETFREAKTEEMVGFDSEVAHVGSKLRPNISNPRTLVDELRDKSLEVRDTGVSKQVGTGAGTAYHRETEDNDIELKVTLTRGVWQGKRVSKKRYQVNGVGRSKAKFTGNFQVVCFRPEDLRIIEGSPSRRRKFLDSILTQIDSQYSKSLKTYNKALRQRNKVLQLLREQETHPRALEYWDELVIEHGSYLNQMRKELIKFFNKNQPQVSNSQPDNFKYKMIYDHSMMSRERLDQYKHQEIGAGYTLVGPHRDDFVLHFEIRESRFESLHTYGSRGQQRMGVLWLKLQALAYMEAQTSQKPILLLDDIFSELDHEHREIVFELMQHHQSIASTADEHYVEGVHARIETL